MKATTDDSQNNLAFQSYEFDYRKGSIINLKGHEIFMEPRLKELFYILLMNKNDFITREELMSFVWKDIVVSEQSVTKAISDLRKFLVSNRFENLKIITVSKLGYKLEVQENQKSNLKRVLNIALYTLGVILTLIIIFRALQYEQ